MACASEVYFSPSTDCEDRIVKGIESAAKEIVVAVYSINNRKIISALKAAKTRGVALRILTDFTQATQKSSGVLGMVDDGLDIRVNTKFKIEHNKFGVFDGKLVETGSFNWTGAASRSNSENCIFLSEADVASKYKERFEALWQLNTADGSKAKIAEIRSRMTPPSSDVAKTSKEK
jgi:phosphatidylserine/phosphatidylglycerophosphate/cardiolipin synthase-like enzyme